MKKIFEQGEFSNYRSFRLDEARKAIVASYDYLHHSAKKITTVFISHKHDDLEDLKGILGFVGLKNGQVIFDEGCSRKNIGYLSQQNSMQKDFPASVYEVVISGCFKSKGLFPFYTKKENELAL